MPGVLECAVVARDDPVLGEKAHAFVVVDRPGAPEETALAAWCRERLADYKVPEFWTIDTEPLPRNANGKVMKDRLRS